MKRLILEEMTWPEVEKYMENIKLAIIPTGSMEQHGPHLTFATDSVRAYEVSKMLAEKLFPDVLVCPPFNYGISPHHMAFPGTITLSEETFLQIILDITDSLKKHGIKRVLFINAHGGNRNVLSCAINKLKFDRGIKAAWIGSGTDMSADLLEERGATFIRGHACEGEVSQCMYLAPELVREESLKKGELKDTLYKKRKWWGQVPWAFDEITANGALGDATLASVELGKDMTKLVISRIESFIREYFLNEII